MNLNIKSISLIIDDNEYRNFHDISFKITSKYNTHSLLNLKFTINKHIGNSFLFKYVRKPFKVLLKCSNDDIKSFTYVMNNIEVESYNNLNYIKIIGVSPSFYLGEVFTYGAFFSKEGSAENVNDLFLSLVEEKFKNEVEIIREFKLNELSSTPFLTLRESVWNGLLRFFSRCNIAIFPKLNGSLVIGRQEGCETTVTLNSSLEKSSNENSNTNNSSRVEVDLRKTGSFFTYSSSLNDPFSLGVLETKMTNKLFEIGESVAVVDGEERIDGVISSLEITLDEGMIIASYKISTGIVPNHKSHIKGSALFGKVVSVTPFSEDNKSSSARLQLNIKDYLKELSLMDSQISDLHNNQFWFIEKMPESIFDFLYTTEFSQSNTGFFCTPEAEDTVSLYFPTDDERDAYIIGAVGNNNSERFVTTQRRNYTVPGGDLLVDTDLLSLIYSDTLKISSDNMVTLSTTKNSTFSLKPSSFSFETTKFQESSSKRLESFKNYLVKSKRSSDYSSFVSKKTKELIVNSSNYKEGLG